MAVPEFLRKSRTMQVYVKARKILIHTRQIIASEKNIPKRHQRRFADPLDQAATKLFTCMCMANAIHPATREDYLLRRDYLVEAKASAEMLCY